MSRRARLSRERQQWLKNVRKLMLWGQDAGRAYDDRLAQFRERNAILLATAVRRGKGSVS